MIQFTTAIDLKSRARSEVLVLPFWQEKDKVKPAADFEKLASSVKIPVETGDFKAREGEVLYVYADGPQEKRLVLLGLGSQDKLTVERLRRSYSNVIKSALVKKIKSINILMPVTSLLTNEDLIKGMAEGMLLANYLFKRYKSEASKKELQFLVEKICLIKAPKNALELAQKYQDIAEGVYLARDLVNGNADDVTPQYLAETAKELAKRFKSIKATIFDKKQIEKQKMELLLAVNKGSKIGPTFIILEYLGNPKSKVKTVIVGKGVTYDTGGLNLKPTGSMETMKCDMGGAAACLGTILAAAKLKLNTNLSVVIPSTENSISADSYKPGDVYSSYLGKTVEIGNTDAEGRLILADALAYAVKHLKPTYLIDFATLTGAVEIALGNETTGLMSNNDALADSLIRASSSTFERAWRLPLYEEYRDQLKSDIADIKNVGGRAGGSITAAIFLQEFVDNTPWAHFDIAGTAYLNESRRYHPKHGTGVGVRLMIDFLENLN